MYYLLFEVRETYAVLPLTSIVLLVWSIIHIVFVNTKKSYS